MGAMDHEIAKLTFRNGRPLKVIAGSIIRYVLTENINLPQKMLIQLSKARKKKMQNYSIRHGRRPKV